MDKAEKKSLAESLFINTSLPRKEIAKQCGCSETSLRKWIIDGGWEDIKDSMTITTNQLILEAKLQLKAINDKINTELNGVPNKQLSDAKAVLRKEIESLSTKSLHKYVEVMEDFQTFVTKHCPQKLQEITKLTLDFVEHVASNKKF